MKIAIAEDEILVSEHLATEVELLGHDVIWQEDNPTLVHHKVVDMRPDLVLLDIKFYNYLSGFKIAERLNELKIPFVFVSAYSEDNLLKEADSYKPLGYIVKPFSGSQLKATLYTVQNKLNQIKKDIVSINSGKKTFRFNLSEVYYIQSESVYVNVYTKNETHLIRTSLSKVMDENQFDSLKRVNKSTIINVDLADKITSNSIFTMGKEFKISLVF